MDLGDFEGLVAKVQSLIEACNVGQKKAYTDFYDALIAYVEEIILAKHIKLGASDSVNVVELLFNDITDVLKATKQTGGLETCNAFLNTLKETIKEDRLRSLLGKMVDLRRNDYKIESNILSPKRKKLEENEKMDLNQITFILSVFLEAVLHIHQNSDLQYGIGKLNKDRKEYSFQGDINRVDVINKRTLGRLMVKNVGNEGMTGNENLRKQFQACIDHLQKVPPQIWENASITIYDDEKGGMHKITSGGGKHQFICSMIDNKPHITTRTMNPQDSKCILM